MPGVAELFVQEALSWLTGTDAEPAPVAAASSIRRSGPARAFWSPTTTPTCGAT